VPGRGFLRNLEDLYLSPGEAFAAILGRPRFWLPLLGYLALNLAFTAVWLHQMEPAQFLQTQLEESGKLDRIPPESRGAVMAAQARFFPIIAWASVLLGGPLSVVLVALVLLFIFRLLYAGEVTFPQAMAVVSYSFLAVHLLSTPLVLLVMGLKGDWNLNPQEALQANPTLLFDHTAVSRPVWALLGSLDLFSFWLIGLLALGFGAASRRGLSTAVWGVLGPWGLLVLGKVALAAL
jgi:hypothetical protein